MAAEKDNAPTDVTTPDLYECRRVFGFRLRELREQQGLSPTEVAEKTRVNSEFIAAIEAGEFDRLPGRLFARGFVAAILKLCAVDDDALITEFDALWTDDGIKPAISHSTKMRLAGKKSSIGPTRSTPNPLRRVAVAAFALAFVIAGSGAVWIGYSKAKPYAARLLAKYGKSVVSGDPTDDKSAAGKRETGKSDGAAVRAESASEQATKKSDKTETVSSDGSQSLTISVIEPVKIKFETDDEKPVVKDFEVGTYKFGFRKSTDLLIYDAAAVQISFNGKPIGPLGTKGRVRRIGFRADSPDKASF
jgi:cytoskeletal protein RodZ